MAGGIYSAVTLSGQLRVYNSSRSPTRVIEEFSSINVISLINIKILDSLA